MWHTHDGMGWWMLFSGGLWILLLVMVLLAVFAYARSARDGNPGRPAANQSNRAVDIARERYARGEINREEFEQLRRDLNQEEPLSQTSSTA